MFLKTNIWLA